MKFLKISLQTFSSSECSCKSLNMHYLCSFAWIKFLITNTITLNALNRAYTIENRSSALDLYPYYTDCVLGGTNCARNSSSGRQ